jgi:hypothetical protein
MRLNWQMVARDGGLTEQADDRSGEHRRRLWKRANVAILAERHDCLLGPDLRTAYRRRSIVICRSKVRKTGCRMRAASAWLSAADSDDRSRMESHGRSESINMQF